MLWAFRRRLATGDGQDLQLTCGFDLTFDGIQSTIALAAFEEVFVTLENGLCRDLHFNCLCKKKVSSDERDLLNLIAACQHQFEGQSREIACSLVGPSIVECLTFRAVSLAMVMKQARLAMPMRAGNLPPTRPRGVVLH
ncbi:MAG: hypothetical protein ACFB6S_06185 [Geminicoccaceae bacterium]